MIELLGATIAVIGTAVVAYTDWKTGYMPDRYTHALILLGAILLPFYHGIPYAVSGYATAAVVFGVCFVLYTLGQLGGGDVKLFTALALLIPTYPTKLAALGFQPVTAPYPFVLSVFFGAAVLAMLFVSLGYMVRLYKRRRKIRHFRKKTIKGAAFALLLLPLAAAWAYINPNMVVVIVPMAAGAFVLAFKDDILRLFIVKKKKVSELNEDDVIATELIPKKTLKQLGIGVRKTFLDAELPEIKKSAKRHGIKEIWVSEYLPRFGPYLLASLLLNLALGDALLWLLFA